VIKLGEHGAMLRTAADYVVVPAYPLEEIVDPTGPGTPSGAPSSATSMPTPVRASSR
jgi:hypothetical protein